MDHVKHHAPHDPGRVTVGELKSLVHQYQLAPSPYEPTAIKQRTFESFSSMGSQWKQNYERRQHLRSCGFGSSKKEPYAPVGSIALALEDLIATGLGTDHSHDSDEGEEVEVRQDDARTKAGHAKSAGQSRALTPGRDAAMPSGLGATAGTDAPTSPHAAHGATRRAVSAATLARIKTMKPKRPATSAENGYAQIRRELIAAEQRIKSVRAGCAFVHDLPDSEEDEPRPAEGDAAQEGGNEGDGHAQAATTPGSDEKHRRSPAPSSVNEMGTPSNTAVFATRTRGSHGTGTYGRHGRKSVLKSSLPHAAEAVRTWDDMLQHGQAVPPRARRASIAADEPAPAATSGPVLPAAAVPTLPHRTAPTPASPQRGRGGGHSPRRASTAVGYFTTFEDLDEQLGGGYWMSEKLEARLDQYVDGFRRARSALSDRLEMTLQRLDSRRAKVLRNKFTALGMDTGPTLDVVRDLHLMRHRATELRTNKKTHVEPLSWCDELHIFVKTTRGDQITTGEDMILKRFRRLAENGAKLTKEGLLAIANSLPASEQAQAEVRNLLRVARQMVLRMSRADMLSWIASLGTTLPAALDAEDGPVPAPADPLASRSLIATLASRSGAHVSGDASRAPTSMGTSRPHSSRNMSVT